MKSKSEELRLLNNKLDEQINEENQPLFTDMICYIREANLSMLTQEMVRHDLSDIVLSAQSRGENIKDVIGEDVEAFCNEVILNLPARTIKEKWIERINIFCLQMSILGIINIVFATEFHGMIRNLVAKQPINYNMSVSVGMITSNIALAIASVYIMKRISRNALIKGDRSHRLATLILCWCLGLFLLSLITYGLGNIIVFNGSVFYYIGIIVILFVVHKWLSKRI